MRAKNLILCSLILLFFLPTAASADERVVDNAGLLSSGQKAELIRMADSIAANYGFDLVIVTEASIGNKSAMDYADDFFDYNGYGIGEGRDGCLFLQVTGSRDYWFSTSGRGIGLLNSSAFKKLEADAVKFLKEDNPYEAYKTFILNWEKFLTLEAQGRSYNFFFEYNVLLVSISWAIAFAIGFIVVSIWKKGMNTALPQTQAAAYIIPGSLSFKEKKDSFLYSTVTKTKRETQSSSGGGTHTSSSGRSHGGGGGKY
jgi:uncharacterized protein